MRRILPLIIGTVLLWSCASNNPSLAHIFETKDINELSTFIKKNPKHKDIVFLKQKLLFLQIAANPKKAADIPKPVIKTIEEQEAEEFAKLMALDKSRHNAKTVNVLNQMFNNDISDTNAILLVANNSDCNMILRIQGDKYYNLAVPAKGQNTLVLPQGTYKLTGSLCGATYTSTKVIQKNLSLALGTARK
ncbi:DUF6759 domain-containing protein [Elizabethkingia anophelis]|uniref:DUF6759 domain-containing protein n=1 Tax=Elizabethkingia anophelis TaxID=1117645 RepID=UPI000463E218|nr:DUF6759 domain-containing protein [Elizabethkingia anophelis]